MAIRVQPKGLAGLYGKLGALAGRVTAAQREAERAESFAQAIVQQQLSQRHEAEMAQFNADLRLEAEKRSRLWELEKMEMASRADFAREEQSRQRKLDNIDNAMQQLDKEVLAGRMSEEEVRPLKLKYQMNKLGLDVPVSFLRPAEEERYGVEPYWRKFRDYPEESPERQLYDAKMRDEAGVDVPSVDVPSRTDVSAAVKFLTEYEEKKGKAAKFYHPFAPEPTEEEETVAEYFRDILRRARVTARVTEGIESAGAVGAVGVGAGIPVGGISTGLPEPKTQQEYNMIPSGSQYIDSSGNIRTKR